VARTIPPDRLSQLVQCATDVFIAQGYQRTQMADVAAALGVAVTVHTLDYDGKPPK